ncbi:MAG: penicillin acylase family protein [Acidimicrobiia bacterium]|nr:MAG: penicillin acylase family protein [Acidimicrobiia bacterium]
MGDSQSTLPNRDESKKKGVFKKLLWTFLGLLVAFVVLAIAFAQVSVHRAFPQVDGTIQIEGLSGSVTVIRDSLGIPHIYADSAEDLMMAQGYVHAQDRFYQMDFWRHISYGTLSEMFGEDSIETDAFLRTMGWGRQAEAQFASETPELKSLLESYAAGVNAYLATQSPADLSFEYSILELTNRNYTPEPWTPAQSLAWGKVMSWDLSGNHGAEIGRALALGVMSSERVDQLYPEYPGDRNPYIVDSGSTSASGVGATVLTSEALQTPLRSAAYAIDALSRIAGGDLESGIGSNSWAIAGKFTDTGSPLLMNDPHLSAQMPSIWYQVGLHCNSVSDDCPYDVAGFSFAGVPGVIIGHNADIAWGFTNVGPDVQDLYIEKINPENPNQYEYRGEWLDMDVRTETLTVAGGDDVQIEVRSTIHGPILSGIYEPLDDFADTGLAKPEQFEVAMRWTALDEVPSIAGPILGINTASNFEEFREAALLFAVPSQNLLYADTKGNIGYQMPGNIPIRSKGDGTLPVPGWSGEYEWTGFIPYGELPYVFNPPSGYIVTANNAVIDGSYPYLITKDWSYGYRARRIVDLVTSNFGIGTEGNATIQFDSYDLNAQRIIPFLEAAMKASEINLEDVESEALNELLDWDLQNFAESTGAAVWNTTWRNLLDLTFNDELPEDIAPSGGSRWFEVMYSLVDNPEDEFWDDVNTSDVETRDDMIVAAFFAGVSEARDRMGSDVGGWTWGELHRMIFVNQTLGKSGIGIIEDRFNRGPFPASGATSVVNAVGWDATEGYDVNWLPSMRMLVDLGDLTQSRAIHTTGQSGHIDNKHYIDMAPLWLKGETVPMLWAKDDIEADAEATLVLVP